MTTALKSRPSQLGAAARRPVVHRLADRAWFEAIKGESLSFRVRSQDVGGRFTILDSIASPSSGTPLHTHKEDEIFEVLEGTMTFVCDGERIEAPPGTVVVVPAGTPHAWANLSLKRVSMRVTLMPGSIEEFFTRLYGASPAEIESLAAEYGTAIVGPPI